ncbi:hypothetical protein AB0H29_08205 [Streptomyces thermolilacinus]
MTALLSIFDVLGWGLGAAVLLLAAGIVSDSSRTARTRKDDSPCD